VKSATENDQASTVQRCASSIRSPPTARWPPPTLDHLVLRHRIRRVPDGDRGARYGALLALAFGGSRILYAIVGVRYAYSGGEAFLYDQLLPEHLLRTQLIKSVWYMHSQPPLYNIFVGLLAKVPSQQLQTALEQVLFIGAGLVIVLVANVLLVDLGVGRRIAFWVVLVGILASPDYILFENLSLYAYLTTCLLLVATFLVTRYLRTSSTWYGLGAFSALAGVVLLNSTYQWFWLLGAIVIIGAPRWRQTLKVAIVPCLVVGIWYGKDAVMFGTSTTSSWVGMNLANITLFAVPEPTIRRLQHEHVLNALASVRPFLGLNIYVPRFVRLTHTGVGVLDQQLKRGVIHGHRYTAPNFNNMAYIRLSSAYLHEDVALIRADPTGFANAVEIAVRNYFTPSDQYDWFTDPVVTQTHRNESAIAPYVDLYDRLVEWQPRQDRQLLRITGLEHALPPLSTLSYQAAIMFGLTLVGLPFLRRRELWFIWFTCLYGLVLPNMIELGENTRFRFELGPLPLIAGAVVAVRLFGKAAQAAKRRNAVGAFSDEK